MVEVAPAQEGVGKVLLRIGGDDDHRPVSGRHRLVDFDDVELHLVEDVEHVVLKVRVGLVDLVDEENGPHVGDEGLPDSAHADVFLDIAHVAFGIPEAAVVEAGQRIVLVQGVDQLHARFHVQDDQRHLQALGNGVGEHGLSRAGLPLEQQRHFEGHGDIDNPGQLFIENVLCPSPERNRLNFTHHAQLLEISMAAL